MSVGGDFYCNDNRLTILTGAPKSVGGEFNCKYNNLTSLEDSPQSVGKNFFLTHNNRLESILGSPNSLGGNFFINLNHIDERHYPVIIPQIEEMMEKGIKIDNPETYYYPYREKYYTNKLKLTL
jgi:hypothetical protein